MTNKRNSSQDIGERDSPVKNNFQTGVILKVASASECVLEDGSLPNSLSQPLQQPKKNGSIFISSDKGALQSN